MKNKILTTLTILSTFTYLNAMDIVKSPEPKKEKAKTTLGLYVSGSEAGKYLNANKNAILVDVRSPSELLFIGAANRMDIHVPLMTIDDSKYNKKFGSYDVKKNKYAIDEIVYELNKKSVKKDEAIFITCRSGSSRAAPVVNALAKKGFTNVWTLIDGYEGGKAKSGNFKGERVVDGWLHSNLEWSWKVPSEKLWFKCKYKDLMNSNDAAKCNSL
ncbi:rhodanese-like domain-containing protein [Poseidonibacter ostreae]|jgi:rhodanese-related sulfurtransferase|uniref:Sulfurtransferase n=1 Tax=Poseidonibacter ostreae TaxID=2654171 RepID=A0A6L4WPQ3_9BACT|nr:rhodanese-like domain-containing protein [Poseidonibacter ostreae]KAB7886114.1 sulfurtransferase [Poseidonibacter ostreae]KAB7888208.1 sulfurtransferase [Poseidonibacter ostreae]KAB7889800.1 sulfurtransferase [Poseidonibacter ostreae]